MLQSMRSAAKYIFWFIAITFIGGFLLAETSGLLGTTPTVNSTVAEVNGREIPYQVYAQATQARAQEEEQRLGRGLTLDERQRIDDEVFEQLVSQILLEQEYQKRGIRVTEEEIVQAARESPPPQFYSAPELQTEGRFDLAKYQRFLASPAARQQGLLVQLENYYRTEIPRAKLFEQLAGNVQVSDGRLWQAYRDMHDSAQVSFVSFLPTSINDSAVTVSDAEIRRYYDQHRSEFERPGRAAVSVVVIPRTITAADSAAVRNRLLALRSEIMGGAKFEDVAKRESADTISGPQGGDLGRGARGRFVKEFEDAAYQLSQGEVSQPVPTSFGYHLIKVDERKGDTLALRHILLRIQQSDSNATRTDRRADSLANIAASADRPERLDSAARVLNLQVQRGTAIEGEPLFLPSGQLVPSVSAWAFSGVNPGETSELFDSEEGYFLARLDSVTQGGVAPLESVREDIRRQLAQEKKLDQLVSTARAFAQQAASSSLEQAAQASNRPVVKTELFNRFTTVPELGRANEAIGAAFALPLGAVSAPIKTSNQVVVMRVDRRVEADSAKWVEQKAQQREQALNALRQQRIRSFLETLRKSADVEDNRKEILGASRAAQTTT